jgi:hypothetical protein
MHAQIYFCEIGILKPDLKKKSDRSNFQKMLPDRKMKEPLVKFWWNMCFILWKSILRFSGISSSAMSITNT